MRAAAAAGGGGRKRPRGFDITGSDTGACGEEKNEENANEKNEENTNTTALPREFDEIQDSTHQKVEAGRVQSMAIASEALETAAAAAISMSQSLSMSQSQPLSPTTSSNSYLLTGCDAFLTHEPGLMDAMALVHARVARVVFARPALGGRGAFLTGKPIHEASGMNHRYLVYVLEP